ncbi:integrase core domain-containing protein [Fundidesulfovibrio soli]|uniref:integrase core domain-containing protein n=1 Tax=Fundidesulfovibrio soli TaxID=2922716 RepID=UPI003AFA4655
MGREARSGIGAHQPGRPTQNSYDGRLNRTSRHGVLHFHVFNSLGEVMEIVQDWVKPYNEQRHISRSE